MTPHDTVGARPQTKAGRLLLMSGLAFQSGRRLADHPDLILAIEDQARRAFLDELIVTGTVAPMMSYDELKDVTDRLIARMQESFREADHA